MIMFVSDKLLKSTIVVGDNIYAPSDDGTTEIPEELRIALGVIPMVNVQPQATTEEEPVMAKKG